MDLSRDIHPLTDFKRHTAEFLMQLKSTGQPVVLTINGKAELIVQDAASYQKLLDLADRLETIKAVKEGLASVEKAEGKPMDEVFDALEKQFRQGPCMTYEVIVQPRAERDIGQAARYIFEQSKSQTTALRWVRRIRAKIDTLKSQPLRCPVDPDSDAYGTEVRVLLFGKERGRFRILFAVRSDTVHVLTVRHAARQSLREQGEEFDTGPIH